MLLLCMVCCDPSSLRAKNLSVGVPLLRAQAPMPVMKQQPASLLGRVTNETGVPLAAELMVYGRAIVNGRVDLFAMCSTATDSEGKYACNALRPGKYLVSATVTPPAPQAGVKSAPAVYPRTFSPSSVTLADATIVSLEPGATGVADVMMRSSAPGELVGHLSDRPASPSFLVLARYGKFELPVPSHTEYDAASGTFHVTGLPTGEVKVSVGWGTAGRVHHNYGIASVLGGQQQTLLLTELGRRTFSGRLRYSSNDETQPVLPASVELLGLGTHAGWHLEEPVAKDGSFAFPEMADGDYALQVPLESGAYVSGIGGRPNDVLHLNAGMPVESSDVTLGTTAASITGEISSGEVMKDRTGIVLEALSDESVRLISPSPDGHFALSNLPPGSYRVFAWTDITEAEYQNPAELVRQKKSSVEISVDDHSHLTNVELTLITAGT